MEKNQIIEKTKRITNEAIIITKEIRVKNAKNRIKYVQKISSSKMERRPRVKENSKTQGIKVKQKNKCYTR